MAMIKINDLPLSEKLDQQAMSKVCGGNAYAYDLTNVMVSSVKSRTNLPQQSAQQIFRQRLEGAGGLIGW